MRNIEQEVRDLKSFFNDKNQKDSETAKKITEENKIEAENNKEIFEKSGLPYMLRTIVNEKIIDSNLYIGWDEYYLNIELIENINKQGYDTKNTLFRVDLSANDEIIVNNSDDDEKDMWGIILPSNEIANFIFNVINRNNNDERKHFDKKTIDTPREKEKERKAKEQYQKNIETFENSFAYKYVEELINSKTIKEPIFESKINIKNSFLRKIETTEKIITGYDYASMQQIGFFDEKVSLLIDYMKNYDHCYITIFYNTNDKKYWINYEDKGEEQSIEINKENISKMINQAIQLNTQCYPQPEDPDSWNY